MLASILVVGSNRSSKVREMTVIEHLPVSGYDHVTFENHVNVIHRGRGPIGEHEALQLATFLNSELVDTYFRTFSGSTQVNATDLRRMRFPRITGDDLTPASCLR